VQKIKARRNALRQHFPKEIRIAFVETKGGVQLHVRQESACCFDPWLAWPLKGDMWVNGVKAPVQFRRRSLSKPWSTG
jgi:hypothetical protein